MLLGSVPLVYIVLPVSCIHFLMHQDDTHLVYDVSLSSQELQERELTLIVSNGCPTTSLVQLHISDPHLGTYTKANRYLPRT